MPSTAVMCCCSRVSGIGVADTAFVGGGVVAAAAATVAAAGVADWVLAWGWVDGCGGCGDGGWKELDSGEGPGSAMPDEPFK